MKKPSYKPLDLVFVAIRAPIALLFLPFALLAATMVTLGHWGGQLRDALEDLSRTITMHLNPRSWELLKELKEERDAFERGEHFWKTEAKALQETVDKLTNTPTDKPL
jgi:hypothetical protein